MRNITRTSIALLGAVALTGVTAISASAATDTTNATVEVTAGALTIAVTEATLPFGAAAPGATPTGAFTGINVSDLTADTVGWDASVSITNFTSVANGTSIPAQNFSYTASAPTATSGSATRSTAAGPITGVAAGVATEVQDATAVTGNNTATWNSSVSLLVPANALAATDYTATLTHSVL